MTQLARSVVTPIWLLLVAATVLSYVLGADYGPGNHTAATVAVMTVAFVKATFVGLYFMELRDAVPALRLAFLGWVALFLVLVITIYVLS